jgi:predicted metal-dependent RNase
LFLLKSEILQGCVVSPLLFNRNSKQSNKTRGRNTKKDLNREGRIQTTLFADDIIIYLRDPKNSTKTTVQIHKLSKVAGYKINIQKSILFLYINNEKSEKEIREIIPFTIVSKISTLE